LLLVEGADRTFNGGLGSSTVALVTVQVSTRRDAATF
jgi:hypothetical protein